MANSSVTKIKATSKMVALIFGHVCMHTVSIADTGIHYWGLAPFVNLVLRQLTKFRIAALRRVAKIVQNINISLIMIR